MVRPAIGPLSVCPVCLSVMLVYCGQTVGMDQDETWHGGRPWPRPHCVIWGPISPEKGAQQPPTFRPMYCGPTAGWSKMALGMEVGLGPGDSVGWEPSSPKKRHSPPLIFGPCLLWPNSRPPQLLLRSCILRFCDLTAACCVCSALRSKRPSVPSAAIVTLLD